MVGLVLVALLSLGAGARYATSKVGGKGGEATLAAVAERQVAVTGMAASKPVPVRPRPLPIEVRGVHVTGPLASLPGRLQEYVALRRHGLNTIELDIKDEGGEVGFTSRALPLSQRVGAARTYYDPKEAAALMHRNGIYLIGRVVVFQDPYLAAARPDLAIRNRDGSVWKTVEGLAWVNPYDMRVWDYVVDVAEQAAKAGFDEIMFDYVRFPSDGDTANAVYPGKTSQLRGRVIESFVAYAKRRLQPYGVRVSSALFGLAASHDLGVGQVPRWISGHVDTISPMAYPALYGPGQLGIADPSRSPGETVFRTLSDFRRATSGSRVLLVPWIQDFSGYGVKQVRAQVDAARLQGAKGFLLWNALGIYTKEALAPADDVG